MCKLHEKISLGLLVTTLTHILNFASVQAADFLFNNGRTSYRIVVSQEASVTEKTAAKELKESLEQISGASFELSSIPGRKNIFVGYCKDFIVYRDVEPCLDNFEGFIVKKIGHDLVIYGGRERGTMYGVFRFLQSYLGVQWYTPDFTKVPCKRKFKLRDINMAEEPKILYRYTDFFCAQDMPWLAHNMMNTVTSKKENVYGIRSHYWGVHTLGKFLPATKYFKTHPEYYAYRNFHRLDYGQLCLTNPEVLKLVTEKVISVIDRYPDYLIYDVSQDDNQSFCTCESCAEIERLYGGHSGLMVWFVNNVAREVKKKYPDKYVGTFAYQYTRHAPTNIKPDDNVVIRLCDIECCFSHPLSYECNVNNSVFMKDLKEWGKLTKNLCIWDYIVNYGNYIAPFPNIHVLGPNLRTFSENGVIDVFEEGQSGTLGNAFEELKCWVLAQLMWNPYQDTDELVKQFVTDYYETASEDILKYYYLCLSLINENTHLTCFSEPTKPPFTDQFNEEAYRILDRALAHANNDIVSERVQKVRLQPMALECSRHPKEFYKKGLWPFFKRQIIKYNAFFKMHESPEKFINSFETKAAKY